MLMRFASPVAAAMMCITLARGLAAAPPPAAPAATTASRPPAAATRLPVPASNAAPSAAALNPKAGVLLDRIVAVVNDDVILKSELDERVAQISQQLQARGTPPPPLDTLRKQVLDQMILTKLELQEAAARGITVSEDELNQTLSRIAERNGITLEQLPAKLAQQGLDYAAFRKELREQIIIRNLEEQVINDQMHITPREVQAQIEADELHGDANTQYHLAEILIATPLDPTPAEVTAARNKAEMIYRKLKQGADFATLAVEYSQDQQALKGGDLGWRKGSELPTVFADTVRDMKPGDFSTPIASASGFHIVKLIDVKRAANKVLVTQTHARHILIRVTALMSDAQAKAKLEQLRKEILAGADFAKLAREYSDDTGSAAQGGDLGWLDPGATVPEFQAQMDKLQVGQISEPFKTQYGWHIVQVLGRRQADQTEEFTKNKAYQAIYARKSEEILQRWLTALKGSAYIEYQLQS